jgi:hypothetical protein
LVAVGCFILPGSSQEKAGKGGYPVRTLSRLTSPQGMANNTKWVLQRHPMNRHSLN